jgi:hypothetical protein
MKDQDQNIAVAKFHGYKIESGMEHNCRYKITDTGGGVCYCDYLEGHIPDYGKDLNATHQAEEMLNPDQWMDYIEQLEAVTHTDGWPIMTDAEQRKMIHASASQRREAMLRTLNLYVGE